MSKLTTDLTDRLTNTGETGLDAGLLIPLLRLLVEGDPVSVDVGALLAGQRRHVVLEVELVGPGRAHARPVTVADLARDSGRSHAEIRAGLGELADTEYDDAGAIVGPGITLRPTPHQFSVDGHRLYTWCALDTLIFPTILNRPAHVLSPAPRSGKLVRLHVDPTAGVTALTPPTAVVTVPLPEQGAGVRSTFCTHVHFYPDRAAAQDWLTDHPGSAVLTIEQAAALGRRLAQNLLGG
jgi:alkylmercury lyase